MKCDKVGLEPFAIILIYVYRKHQHSIDREWHFHTLCSHWPEMDFEQRRYLEQYQREQVCEECTRLESEMFRAKMER